MPLVIIGWNERYENNRTRELKRMDWVPVPNRMDGAGYTELVDHPNGAAHLGGWLVILEIASRQTVRGTIPQEGAALCGMLARVSRLPREIFEELLPRLVQVEWIEPFEKIPQEGAGIPQDDAEECLRARARFPSVPFPSVPINSIPEEKKIAISKPNFGPHFEAVTGAFLAAGVLLSEQHIYAAAQEWSSVPESEHAAAAECAKQRAKHHEARFMGLPASWIRKAEWRARGPGRLLPDPPGKSDISMDIAAKNFLRKRGIQT